MTWRRLGAGYYKAYGPSGRTYWARRAGRLWGLHWMHDLAEERLVFHPTLRDCKRHASELEGFIERQVSAGRDRVA
jgi:hypothetical protein